MLASIRQRFQRCVNCKQHSASTHHHPRNQGQVSNNSAISKNSGNDYWLLKNAVGPPSPMLQFHAPVCDSIKPNFSSLEGM